MLFSVATSHGSCGVLKTSLETPGFNADRLVVSEDVKSGGAFPSPQGPELAADAAWQGIAADLFGELPEPGRTAFPTLFSGKAIKICVRISSESFSFVIWRKEDARWKVCGIPAAPRFGSVALQ